MRIHVAVSILPLFLLATPSFGRMQTQPEASSSITPEMVLQFGHAGAIAKLIVSPDGRQLLSIGLDHTIRVWDVPTGGLLRTMPQSSGESFRTAFYQQADRPVAVGLAPRDIRIRDLASGQAVVSMPAGAGTDASFADVAISGDHETFALRIGALGAPITLYSAKTGALLASLDTPGITGGSCLGLSHDGSLLLHAQMSSFGGRPATDVWDVKAHHRLFTLPDANGAVHALLSACPEFTADGRSLVIAGRDGAVRIWDARTGQLLRTFESTTKRLPPEPGVLNPCSSPCISALAADPDGRWVATGETDATVSLREVSTGREVRHIKNLKGAIYAVAIGPQGKWVAYGGDDYDIRILDVPSGQTRVLSTNPDLVRAVACSVPANSCAFATLDKRIRLWNFTTERERVLSIHSSRVNAVSFSTDGRWLVSGDGDNNVKICDAGSGAELRSLSGQLHPVTSVAFSPDGRWVASGSTRGEVKLWERETHNAPRTLARQAPVKKGDWDPGVAAVHFNLNGRELTVSYLTGEMTVFDIATGAARHSFHAEHQPGLQYEDSPSAVAFSPDDRLIVTTHGGNSVVWNAAAGTFMRRLPQGSGWVLSAAFSPDGRWLATGSADRTISLWDTNTWKSMLLRGHQGFVKSLAFGPDSRRLLSGSGDGTVRVWDVASARMMAVVASQKGGQSSLVVSPNGLFEGTADSMQQVAWRIPNTLDVAPLDAFFTDFFRPGLFGDLMAGGDPAPEVDFAAVLQVPGLRTMLAQKQAHIETRGGQATVCFAEPPGAAADVPVTEQQLLPRLVRGFRIDPQDPTCPYQKELPVTGADPAAAAQRLRDWKPRRSSTVWDGKKSTDTATSTLHVFVAGVGEYPVDSGFDRLPYAVSSARAIESFFKRQASSQSPFAAVRVWDGLYDAGATKEAIGKRLNDMARTIKDNDVVLLYFAGHGIVSSRQEMFYFVPIDGLNGDLRHSGVSAAILADGIRSLEARRVVLTIDACQSGGAVEPLSQIAAVKAQVEARRAKGEREAPGHEHGVGVHIIAATLPLSYAVQITQEQSALAATMLTAFQQGRETTIGEVSSYISQHLPDASARVAAGFRQVPMIESIGLDFPIARR